MRPLIPSRHACVLLALLGAAPARADLAGYLGAPDPEFAWRVESVQAHRAGTAYAMHLVSQAWHGAPWQHDLRVYVPERSDAHALMLLLVAGSADEADERGWQLADAVGAPVAILHDVPNQPLLEGKREDDLIAATFLRFLTTGDQSWPLLLPMTKSVTRAMDALQAFARENLQRDVQGFVVTGASKRGWTSWLTAGADARVKGVVPLVIDMLNVPAQLPHQLASWGDYSEMLRPYTNPQLPSFIGTPRGQQLVAMVDPYAYRERLTMPKLIVLGTNDRYWTLDALNLYWDALPGSKQLLYVPNAGHRLGDPRQWTESLGCFFRQIAAGDPLPRLGWHHVRNAHSLELQVDSTPAPRAARLWWARSPSRDFREASWEARALPAGSAVRGAVPLSKREFAAAFAEVSYSLHGRECSFSTQVRIEPPDTPIPGQ